MSYANSIVSLINKPLTPNSWEILINDYFNLIKEDVNILVAQAVIYSKIGNKVKETETLNNINKYYYFLYYALLIKRQIQFDYNIGIIQTWTYYEDLYSLDCVVKSLSCARAKTKQILELFGFELNTSGIGYQTIDSEDLTILEILESV